jgi:hypothetical protein
MPGLPGPCDLWSRPAIARKLVTGVETAETDQTGDLRRYCYDRFSDGLLAAYLKRTNDNLPSSRGCPAVRFQLA